jgi:hypothetical protein
MRRDLLVFSGGERIPRKDGQPEVDQLQDDPAWGADLLCGSFGLPAGGPWRVPLG